MQVIAPIQIMNMIILGLLSEAYYERHSFFMEYMGRNIESNAILSCASCADRTSSMCFLGTVCVMEQRCPGRGNLKFINHSPFRKK